jgi:hypothetical protein
MQNVIAIAERHALLIVFLNVLLSQGGLPLPAVPTLMTAAALARQSPIRSPKSFLRASAALSLRKSRCIGVVCAMDSAF